MTMDDRVSDANSLKCVCCVGLQLPVEVVSRARPGRTHVFRKLRFFHVDQLSGCHVAPGSTAFVQFQASCVKRLLPHPTLYVLSHGPGAWLSRVVHVGSLRSAQYLSRMFACLLKDPGARFGGVLHVGQEMEFV